MPDLDETSALALPILMTYLKLIIVEPDSLKHVGDVMKDVGYSERGVRKVKCTLVQALKLCTGRTAHRGSRGVALPLLDHST